MHTAAVVFDCDLDNIQILPIQQACGVLNIDIISVNLSERLPFNFKHAQIKQVCSDMM